MVFVTNLYYCSISTEFGAADEYKSQWQPAGLHRCVWQSNLVGFTFIQDQEKMDSSRTSE